MTAKLVIDITTSIEEHRTELQKLADKLPDDWTMIASYPKRGRVIDEESDFQESGEEYEEYMNTSTQVTVRVPAIDARGPARFDTVISNDLLGDDDYLDTVREVLEESWERLKRV